jgi:hypothetical protein
MAKRAASGIDLANEIFDAFIKAGDNPSDRLFDHLAKECGMTADVMKDHYKGRYRNQTGNDDDPFDPVMPIIA